MFGIGPFASYLLHWSVEHANQAVHCERLRCEWQALGVAYYKAIMAVKKLFVVILSCVCVRVCMCVYCAYEELDKMPRVMHVYICELLSGLQNATTLWHGQKQKPGKKCAKEILNC